MFQQSQKRFSLAEKISINGKNWEAHKTLNLFYKRDASLNHLSSGLIFFSYGGKHAAKFEKSTTICIPCPEFCVKMGKIGLVVDVVGK